MADGIDGGNNAVLECFLDWCKQNDLSLSSKVKVGTTGSCHRYGMVATDAINKGETIFEIPRKLLLSPTNCSISHFLHACEFELSNENQRSGWAPLLVALMYEYTNPTSFWRPYLELVPPPQVLGQPMFWTEKERQSLLCNTDIEKSVEEDLNNIEEEFSSTVLPFLKKHEKYFHTDVHTLRLYKHMVGFVMAYSFTEEAPDPASQAVPVMVPMADILNHHSYNNAQLEFGTQSLTMVATDHMKKGQEVFNTYGKLGNAQLLQMYGFVEETPNPYDSVDIPVQYFRKTVTHKLSVGEKLLIDTKFQLMIDAELVYADDVFRFNKEGCSHYGPDLAVFLKILHLTAAKLRQLVNELLNPSRAFSEEFQEIRDEICDTIDLNPTLRTLNEIFCEEVKFSHVSKRANTSCGTNNISNKLCENIPVKRKRVSQQAVEKRIGEQDFLGIGNSIDSESEEVKRQGNVSRETKFDFSNRIVNQSSKRDNCYSRMIQSEIEEERECFKKYKGRKEAGELLKNLEDYEEDYEDQPKKEKGEEGEEDDEDEDVEVDYEEREGDEEGLGSDLEQDEEADYEDEEDLGEEGLGGEQERKKEVKYEEKEDGEEGLGGDLVRDKEVDYEEKEDNEVGLGTELEEDEDVEYEENDENEDDESDDDKDQVLTYETSDALINVYKLINRAEQIAAFPAKWRETLASTAEKYLQDQSWNELKEEHSLNPNSVMSQRQKVVQLIKLGTMSLLQKIIKCNSYRDIDDPLAGVNEH